MLGWGAGGAGVSASRKKTLADKIYVPNTLQWAEITMLTTSFDFCIC